MSYGRNRGYENKGGNCAPRHGEEEITGAAGVVGDYTNNSCIFFNRGGVMRFMIYERIKHKNATHYTQHFCSYSVLKEWLLGGGSQPSLFPCL